MKLINQTKHTTLSTAISEAKTVKQKAVGLLSYNQGTSMLFHTRLGIHTFGMKYAIDVIILGPTNRVVHARENLKQNRIFFWNPRFSTVVELPKDTLQKSRTTVGDLLQLC